MITNQLDALLFPGSSSAGIAAKAGHPTVIVPFGMIPNAPTPAFPAGFNAKDQPYGVSFAGTACSEQRLIDLAYGFRAGDQAPRAARFSAVKHKERLRGHGNAGGHGGISLVPFVLSVFSVSSVFVSSQKLSFNPIRASRGGTMLSGRRNAVPELDCTFCAGFSLNML